jgi:hypothetical protein
VHAATFHAFPHVDPLIFPTHGHVRDLEIAQVSLQQSTKHDSRQPPPLLKTFQHGTPLVLNFQDNSERSMPLHRERPLDPLHRRLLRHLFNSQLPAPQAFVSPTCILFDQATVSQ